MRRLRALIVLVVLAVACGALGCGWVHRWTPHWHRDPGAPPVYDLNRASLRKIKTLPGITPSMAERIVDGRPYESPRELVTRGILTEPELKRIEDRVSIDGKRD